MLALHSAVFPPWSEQSYLGTKPFISNYGYIWDKRPVPCETFAQLRSCVAWDRSRKIKQVWTPDEPWLVPPEEVPDLFGDVYHREQLYRRQSFRNSLLSEAIWALWGLLYLMQSLELGIFFIAAIVGIPLLQSAWNLHRSRFYTPKEALDDGEKVRFGVWLSGRRSLLTICMVIAISLIWFVQFTALFAHIFTRPGQQGWTPTGAVGLVKSAVWNDGEWWRLFTATVMHTAIWHIMFNMLALLVLGRLVEALAGWEWMGLVFFLSAFVGSVFSLVLLPATSIGSSGGIMGLLGFLVALGYLRRGFLPAGFFRLLLTSIGLVFIAGFVGFAIVDNAAHLGGLIGGALLGLLAAKISSKQPGATVPLRSNLALSVIGTVATICITATIGGTIFLLLSPME